MATHEGPFRFGIVGYGSFAERAIAPAIKATPGAVPVAVQKRSLEAARAGAKEAGIPLAFATVEEMVAHPDVDAVFICSANGAHCAETIAAARAGKHVLVEKPMAVSVREAELMIEECARHNVRLMVGHMIRFSPLVRRMREIVRSGQLGKLVSARADFVYDGRISQREWLWDARIAGGGPIFDVGVHCLDTLRYVLDDEVETVRAVLDPLPTPERTEESAHVGLRFRRGTLGSIFCSFAAPVRRKEIQILGMDGRLSAEEFTVGGITARLTVDLSRDTRPAAPAQEDIVVPNLYVAEIAHFMDAVRTGAPLITPGENGLANQRVLNRAVADIG